MKYSVRPVVAPPWVFYSSPFTPKGVWLRSELCTAQVACPRCKVERWQPCKSIRLGKQISKNPPEYEEIVGGFMGMVHHERRKLAGELDQGAIKIEVRGAANGPDAKGFTITLPFPLPPTIPQEDNVE